MLNLYRLCGFPPFYEENNQKLFDMIKGGQYEFPSPYWDDVSDMAKDLIRNILVVDPKKRLTAEEIYNHPWVSGEKTPRTELPNVTDKMKEYNSKRKWKVRITPINHIHNIESCLYGYGRSQIQEYS